MEPLAPGTEDEPLYAAFPSKQTKKETEEERILSIKAILPNGKYGNVFEVSRHGGSETWFCKVCACPVMGRVFNHESGKRHNYNMAGCAGNFRNREPEPPGSEEPDIVIAPGEPVPPGFEGEVEKVAQIQERLDKFSVGPLVALEYLLELQDYDTSKEPSYLCILCDKKGDPRTVLTHLSSYNHISSYLQKHYPTCYRALAPYMTKQYKRNWQNALQRVAEAIENTYGRLKPKPVEADKFEKNRMLYLGQVAKGKHFSELSGCTFENLVSHDELTKVHEDEKKPPPYDSKLPFRQNVSSEPKRKSPSPPVVARPVKKAKTQPEPRRRSLSSVSSISSSDLEDFDPSPVKKSPSKSTGFYQSKQKPKSFYSRRSRSPVRGRMTREKPIYRKEDVSETKAKEKYIKLQEFKKLSAAIENDVNRIYKQHQQNPEKHPKYNDEWKKFWNKRYKELQGEGKDPSKYDFKPDWISFWNKRILELQQEEIKSKKEALRRRLALPEEPTPISFKIGSKKRPGEKSPKDNKPVPTAALPDNDPEVIVIDDKDGSLSRSSSPWEDSPKASFKGNRISLEKDQERKFTRSTSRERYKSKERAENEKLSRERELRFKKNDYRDISPKVDIKHRRSPIERSRKHSRSRERSWERSRSRENWEKDYDKHWERDYYKVRDRARVLPPDWEPPFEDPYKPPKVLRDVTRQPVLSPTAMKPKPAVEEFEDDGDVNIVAVLRLLTALEDKLGSLGPKVIDLLAQALAMEKKDANSSEKLLDNEMNCVLFETVKEKLKGQLLAGLVDYVQEKAFKIAIKKTASLIHLAGENKKQNTVSRVDPVTVPGIGTVDKGAIARQIANALIAQGKTDVTQAELEQLINAVVGMAEASKNSKQPMTTAAFLEKLTGTAKESSQKEVDTKAKSKEPDPVEDEDSTIGEKAMLSSMEGLSDSELQTLLQNFKDLTTVEQYGLINYLKKLEVTEPERVEKLRKFVSPNVENKEEKKSGRESPFSNRMSSINPSAKEDIFVEDEPEADTKDENKKKKEEVVKVNLDSDEEEYSFEDVAKAASKVVQENERKIEETKKKEQEDNMLTDAKALITSLMSNLNKSNASPVPVPKATSTSTAPKINIISNIAVSSADITKTLNSLPINLDSLGRILGNVKDMNKTPTESTSNKPSKQFDIFSIESSQQSIESVKVEEVKQQINKPYDIFNIEPIAGDAKTPTQQAVARPQGNLQQNRPNVQYPNISGGYGNRFPAPTGQYAAPKPVQFPQRATYPNDFQAASFGSNTYSYGDHGYDHGYPSSDFVSNDYLANDRNYSASNRNYPVNDRSYSSNDGGYPMNDRNYPQHARNFAPGDRNYPTDRNYASNEMNYADGVNRGHPTGDPKRFGNNAPQQQRMGGANFAPNQFNNRGNYGRW